MNSSIKNIINENSTILLVALGGAVAATLVGLLTATRREAEPFPLSPVNVTDNQRGTAPKVKNLVAAPKKKKLVTETDISLGRS